MKYSLILVVRPGKALLLFIALPICIPVILTKLIVLDKIFGDALPDLGVVEARNLCTLAGVGFSEPFCILLKIFVVLVA